MSETRTVVGRLSPTAIRQWTIPRPGGAVVQAFLGLPDLTGMACDAMDELGLAMRAVPATELRPLRPGARICGPALTVRNVPRAESLSAAVATRRSGLAEIEAHNLAEAGDVLVIEGLPDCSSLGGNARLTGLRQGEIGAVVEGAVRDVGGTDDARYPVWCRAVTPVTGKWRVETVEVNGPIVVGGVSVRPGDLVLADDSGIVFLDPAQAGAVLALAQGYAASEVKRQMAMNAGASLAELAGVRKPQG
jgi:4-hydroxy-4-methyl-2-oxoglutarate aldolase